MPLVVAAINWLFFSKKQGMAAALSTMSVLFTLILCIAYLTGALAIEETSNYIWLPTLEGAQLSVGLLLDDMAMRMMLVVTAIGALVHIFSLGYLKGDKSNLTRYFAGLSIFMFSMSTIVLADNLAMTFIGWEMVGLSSYLLIGHWFNKDSAADAAKKAFITNRVGDFGFLIGIGLTLAAFGTLNFSEMGGLASEMNTSLLTVLVLALFCGAIGKSAQFPLHVWLPDAMEGPTPVSALIHAATMVAAGVYMLVRLQVSMGAEAFTPFACNIIAGIGAITALLAAFMAMQQDDIKRVLAYSTLSQLGYMVMAVGLMAGEAAMFHLFTHAWFKALLFLGSGAIIYACHHEQDIWKMGNLKKRMPITTLCFVIGTLALIAVPGFSGFFSKESILMAAYEKNMLIFAVAAGVAALTAFYMVRVCLITFCGKARSEHAEHAKEVGASMSFPLILLAVMSVLAGFGFVAEKLVPFNDFVPEGFHVGIPFYAGTAALIIGVVLAFAIYGRGVSSDPLANNFVSRALRNRLYIDHIYDKYIVGGVQNIASNLIDMLDSFVIYGFVQSIGYCVSSLGQLISKLRGVSLRTYNYVTLCGVIVIIYVVLF